MNSFHWRPHTEKPQDIDGPMPMSALLACVDEDEPNGEPFLLGLYTWHRGEWKSEELGNSPGPGAFWWVPETELVKGLKP